MEYKGDITKSETYTSMPALKSSDMDWIKWADVVMKKYGRSLGGQVFLAAWGKRGSTAANTLVLRQHLKKEYNIEVDETVWNKIVDLGGGIYDTFGKIFKVGKITTLVVGGVIVIAIGAAVYNIVKNKAGKFI